MKKILIGLALFGLWVSTFAGVPGVLQSKGQTNSFGTYNDAVSASDAQITFTAIGDSITVSAITTWEQNDRAFCVSASGDTAVVYVWLVGDTIGSGTSDANNGASLRYYLMPDQSVFVRGIAVMSVRVRYLTVTGSTYSAMYINLGILGNK